MGEGVAQAKPHQPPPRTVFGHDLGDERAHATVDHMVLEHDDPFSHRRDVVEQRLGVKGLDRAQMKMPHRDPRPRQRDARPQRLFRRDARGDNKHIIPERKLTHPPHGKRRVEEPWHPTPQHPAIDRTVYRIRGRADALDLGRVACLKDRHVRDRPHHRDVLDRLMRHAARRGDARQEPHQPHPAARIGDRGDKLVIGTAIKEHAEGMQERPEPGEAEPACETHHVLLGHAQRQKPIRMSVAEPVNLARGGQIGRQAEHLGMGERMRLEGRGIGAVDDLDHVTSLPRPGPPAQRRVRRQSRRSSPRAPPPR